MNLDQVVQITVWEINVAKDLLSIAAKVLEAKINEAEGNLAMAEKLYREAIDLEDQLIISLAIQ